MRISHSFNTSYFVYSKTDQKRLDFFLLS